VNQRATVPSGRLYLHHTEELDVNWEACVCCKRNYEFALFMRLPGLREGMLKKLPNLICLTTIDNNGDGGMNQQKQRGTKMPLGQKLGHIANDLRLACVC